MAEDPKSLPYGEPVGQPVYPVPPPGEYYATARWVKDYVRYALALDADTSDIVDSVVTTLNSVMKRKHGVTGQIAIFDETGQVYGSEVTVGSLEKLSSLDDLLAEKVDKEPGKGLSSNDFTNELRAKLISLTPGGGGAGGSSTPVDPTLELSGYAADAAVVGQRLSDLQTEFDNTVTEVAQSAASAAESASDAVEALNHVRALDDLDVYEDDEGNLVATGSKLATTADTQALHDQLGAKAEADDLTALESELREELATKASQEEVDGKVDKTSLDEEVTTLTNLINSKADSTTVEGKADKAEVSSLETRVNEALAGKADKADLDVLGSTASTEDLAALRAQVTVQLNEKADRTEVSGKVDTTRFDQTIEGLRSKSDLSVYDNEGAPDGSNSLATQQWVRENVSAPDVDLTGLRSKSDMSVYDSQGALVEGDSVATQQWVIKYLSEGYDVAETTSYGTEV